MLHIVLVEPEIPMNTGNIARSCAATGSVLHLVGPLGFSIDDRAVKRAGLDYWHLVDVRYYPSIADFWLKNQDIRCRFASTKAPRSYTEVDYADGDYLFFGKETKGLDEELLKEHLDECVRIPIRQEARSLNLSNSVAIVLFEALRQMGFPHLEPAGKFKLADGAAASEKTYKNGI
jgi:tRNA (cytidine/uridine-2'-O-)-methyltransferase